MMMDAQVIAEKALRAAAFAQETPELTFPCADRIGRGQPEGCPFPVIRRKMKAAGAFGRVLQERSAVAAAAPGAECLPAEVISGQG